MTTDQINIAIAEVCGWTDLVTHKVNGVDVYYGFNADTHSHKEHLYEAPIPDYCSDLNAMVEAIATLTDSEEAEFDMHLVRIMQRDESNGWFIWQASARQQAEAFLKTKGLWHDH